MPRGEVARQISLFADNTPPGCMGGMLQMFDWNSALLGKKLLTDPDFADGLEAPRNSLDMLGGSVGNVDTPKRSSARKEDGPYSFKVGKSLVPPRDSSASVRESVASRDSSVSTRDSSVSADTEKRRRSTSVVARLMGLDPLPDATSVAPSQQTPPTAPNQPKISKEKFIFAQKLLKDAKDVQSATSEQVRASELKVVRDSRVPYIEQGRTSELKSLREQSILRAMQHQRADVDQLSDKDEDFEPLPFRDHPQEKQLQEFKKQFATKLAIQSHENRERRQSESFNREVEVKRVMVQEKMDEAKAVLARGEKNDPKRLAAALDKLNKSREFQEVLEVLQSNKEFFLKFLQEPNAILADKHLQEPMAEEKVYNNTPPETVEVMKPKEEVKSTEKKSKGGISPSSFARRFMESRRNHEPKQKKGHSSSKSRVEEMSPSVSSASSVTSLLPTLRRSKAPSVDKELTVRTAQEYSKQTSSLESLNKKDTYSPGKIVLLRPGSNDSTEISSPASVPSYSPRHFRIVKESKESRGYAVESRAVPEQQHLYRESSRSSSREKGRHSVDCWENYASEETSRHGKEIARHRAKERERSKESRDIARDIIREARAGVVRELGGRGEISSLVGDGSLSRSASTGRRITLLRMAPDSGDVTGSSDGEATPCSAPGRDYHHLRSGTTTGLSSPAGSRTSRSHESITPFTHCSTPKMADGRRKSSAERQKEAALLAVQLEEQRHHLQMQKDLSTPRRSSSSASQEGTRSGSPRRSSSQISSKVLRKAIVGSLLDTQVLSDSRQDQDSSTRHSHDKAMRPKLLFKGERVMSAIPSEDESAVSSPRNLQRCRSVPNAAVMRERSRADHPPLQSQNTRSSSPLRSHEPVVVVESVVHPGSAGHSPASREFADSYKRGVQAVGSLFARAKSKERNKIFTRNRKKGHADQLSLHESSQVSSVTSAGDYGAQCDLSDATPLEWSGVLSAQEDSEADSDVKRISIASDAASIDHPTSRPCVEKDLLQALSMLTPRTQQVRVNVDMATDQCCNSPAAIEQCYDSPKASDMNCAISVIDVTDHLEVPLAEHAAKSPKTMRSVATESLRSEDLDVLKTCVDVGGQPSPVSVLDSPFEEESPSPQENFKEITSDLQELRLRLRLLKLDGSERPRPSLDSTAEEDHETPDVTVCQEFVVREADSPAEIADLCHNEIYLQSKPETPTFVEVLRVSAAEAINQDRALLESIDLEGIPYPEGRKEDLVYVRDLLVASEFVQSVSRIFTRWHSPNQPLDPILFENLEDYYNGCQPQFLVQEGHMKSTAGVTAELAVKQDHRLLFDAVNDVLLKKLGPYLTFHPWVQPSNPLLLRPIATGRQLVLETWTALCSSFPSAFSDASSSLLERELSEGTDSICHRHNLEQLGLELERAILNDLIDNTVLSLTQLSH